MIITFADYAAAVIRTTGLKEPVIEVRKVVNTHIMGVSLDKGSVPQTEKVCVFQRRDFSFGYRHA